MTEQAEQWEYRVEASTANPNGLRNLCNRLGAEGWELAAAASAFEDHAILRNLAYRHRSPQPTEQEDALAYHSLCA